MTSQNKNKEFSYFEYRNIIEHYQPKIKDFSEVTKDDESFCVLRHDVEFVLERALKMAEIDHEYGIVSSFFIQVMNSAYNPLSIKNKKILKQLRRLGHKVGLHLYLSHIDEENPDILLEELEEQAKILEICINDSVDRFSYHRPPKWVLPIDLSDRTSLINAYSSNYFEYLIENNLPKKIKYYSDSNHKWSYGHPLDEEKYSRFQLCIHPDEWTEFGGDDIDNFKNMLHQSRKIFMDNIDSEYKTFSGIRKYL